MRFKGFIGGSYNLPASVNVECQRLINMYLEQDQAGTMKDGEMAFLIGTEGLKCFANKGYGPIRGMHLSTKGDVVYFVSGKTVYVMDAQLTPVSVGDLLTVSGPVSIQDNGISVFIVDNPNGYFGALSTADVSIAANVHAIAQTTDPNWEGSTRVEMVDGYFIFNRPNTFEWYCSNLLDTTINPLGFASKEATDPIVAHLGSHRNIWFFGTETTEVWYNAGLSPGVPFQIIQGSFMEVGCAAAFSVAKVANTIMWLGKDRNGTGTVYMGVGYQGKRVSTHAVEYAIQRYGDLSNAVAWTYQKDGHQFYCLNFPNADTTWCFDLTTQMWHERCGQTNGIFTRHRADCHVSAFGQHIVGDYQNGNLYLLDDQTFTDNGVPIIRRRASPHISADMDRVFFPKFQLDFEPGVGLNSGQGQDPQCMLQWSDDGGHTWSNERWSSIGKIGHTKHRAIWRRLGTARNRVFRITISDPIEVCITGAEIDGQEGAS